MFASTAEAQNVELLSRGDTFTYGRYHIWISNDPQANSDHTEDFFTRNNSIITLRIDNVSSTRIGVQITIRYQNGTQLAESLIHETVTGYNQPSNTIFGDPRASAIDLTQNPKKQIDHTETRKYGGIRRQVNVFSTEGYGWTMHYNTVHNVTIATKSCYDVQTGMFLEFDSEMFVYNRNDPSLNQTIHEFFVLEDTNVWVAPNPPSAPDSPSVLPLTIGAIIAVATVVFVSIMVYLKKSNLRKIRKEQALQKQVSIILLVLVPRAPSQTLRRQGDLRFFRMAYYEKTLVSATDQDKP
jgi:hypothetical protein